MSPQHARRGGFPWVWLPVMVVGACIVPNVIMITRSRSIAPSQVEAKPFERSKVYDEEKAERKRFIDAGCSLTVEARGAGTEVTLTLVDPRSSGLVPKSVSLYRPDDPSADQVLPWPADAGLVTTLTLPRTGRWRILVTGTIADGPIRVQGIVQP